MPCYLFTYHAYGSWLPDRQQGYVIRKQGILPQDPAQAVQYRQRMKEAEKKFSPDIQQSIIHVLLESQEKQSFECYSIATEVSHVHLLLGWRDNRPWLRMRSTVKGSMTRSLKSKFGPLEWLSEGGSRKRVCEQKHFDFLGNTYLPRHRGWKWNRERGLFR